MIIYSKKIIAFIQEVKTIVKQILSKELGLKTTRERFYNEQQSASYPIKVVVYNNKSMLGYFESDFYELGFHECLMHVTKEQLYNVIRHELAHYMVFINFGPHIQPHGGLFREFCESKGWGEEVFRSTICLESLEKTTHLEENSILRKVQKLMALSTSSNPHEAEQAMIKSQQILLKHNLEDKYVTDDSEERIFLKRILKQKKENAKMRAIANILSTFFVSTVYSRTEEFIYLEILGDKVNIEIAEYVAIVLESELENLWFKAQKQMHLRGVIAKNSFFLGIAKGYCNKIQALKRDYSKDIANGLMVIEKKLIDGKEMVYPRLSRSKSRGSFCRESSALGEQMGRELSINPAIHNSNSQANLLIGY